MSFISKLSSIVTGYRENFTSDFLASIVVFLVALPLCMGIAIASGVPPAAGIVTGIIGGIVVGRLSGGPLLVSGPAAGLTVIVFEVVKEHGVAALGLIVLLAGVVQLLAGLLKLGQWFRAVSPAVINGMLSGIGVLIMASQFHVMLDDTPKGSGIENLLTIPLAIWECLQSVSITSTHIAGCVGILSILILAFWSIAPKRLKKILPAALVAVLAATAVTIMFRLDIKTVSLPDNLLSALQFPTAETIRASLNWTLFLQALGVALIASAETLLSASAVDRLHQGPRTKYDQELAGQGVGNIICGALGALPMTGVIVRSSVNVNAGAKTRASTMMHGFWLLLFVVFLPSVLKLIPISCLAAILVYTGFKLTNFSIVRTLAEYGKSEVAIYIITVLVIVCDDLLTGVFVGLALSAAKLLYVFSHLGIRSETHENRIDLHLKGAATFLNLPRLAEALESVPLGKELHVHFDDLDYVDHAAFDLLMNWELQHKAQDGKLVIDWHTLGSMLPERRKTPRRKKEAVLSSQERAADHEAAHDGESLASPSVITRNELTALTRAVAKGDSHQLKRYIEPLGLEGRIALLRNLEDTSRQLHKNDGDIPVLAAKVDWRMEEDVTADSKLRHHLEIQLRKEVLKVFPGNCFYRERLFLHERVIRREVEYPDQVSHKVRRES